MDQTARVIVHMNGCEVSRQYSKATRRVDSHALSSAFYDFSASRNMYASLSSVLGS